MPALTQRTREGLANGSNVARACSPECVRNAVDPGTRIALGSVMTRAQWLKPGFNVDIDTGMIE